MKTHWFGMKVLGPLVLIMLLSACSAPLEAPNDSKTGPRIGATCFYSHTSKDDPIVKPTSEPPAHQHLFYGNESTKQSSTYETLRAASTLCKQEGDKSAWWVPQTFWGSDAIETDRLLVYYQTTPRMNPQSIRVFPKGFSAIGREASWRCGSGEFVTTTMKSCNASTISLRVLFNQCYNPKNQTVEANLAPSSRSECPQTHPVLLPRILIQQNLHIPDSTGPLRVAGNEGIMPASSAHADFINAWDQPRLQELIQLCLKETSEGEVRPDACRTASDEG